MNSRFREFVEEVRGRTDIVELIGADIELRASGKTLKGLSPFHVEAHSSFVVWPDTQTWHDFSNGGGLGGDVFSYLQEREKFGFKEALFALAERTGIRRPDQDDEQYQRELALLVERRDVERLLGQAAAHYHRVLPTKIREEWYRDHYGFTDDTIDGLLLGWADGHLYDQFHEGLGVQRELALKTGLFVVVAGGHIEDFFRDRLVFPYWRIDRVLTDHGDKFGHRPDGLLVGSTFFLPVDLENDLLQHWLPVYIRDFHLPQETLIFLWILRRVRLGHGRSSPGPMSQAVTELVKGTRDRRRTRSASIHLFCELAELLGRNLPGFLHRFPGNMLRDVGKSGRGGRLAPGDEDGIDGDECRPEDDHGNGDLGQRKTAPGTQPTPGRSVETRAGKEAHGASEAHAPPLRCRFVTVCSYSTWLSLPFFNA